MTVEIRPAATVVLIRPGEFGLEVLLTVRPSTMAFAAGMHVFPGGRVDPADSDTALAARSVRDPLDAAISLGGDLLPGEALATYVAGVRELFEEAGVLLADHNAPADAISAARSALLRGEATLASVAHDLDLRLRTDRLLPISRWVTPPGLSRRFDARFFVAELPEGVEPTFEGDEVAGHRWLRPTDGLRSMTAGNLRMWLPTSTTLQQLEHATSIDEIEHRMTPRQLGPIDIDELAPGVTRIVMPAAAGVSGQPVNAYLIGHRRFVLVDPGDPTGPALDRAADLATQHGGAIEAVVLTSVDPDHAAGAEAVAERLGIPVLAGPGGGPTLPYPVVEIGDLEHLSQCDVSVQVLHAPGPRADNLAFIVGDGTHLVSGDLDGVRGARSICGPSDQMAWAASIERVGALAPNATWLPGHPVPNDAQVTL
jgi:glyoxylase-like metal-dependent hydrolase (beta-lactamase superfamily II)/8-oxo-dGTP pyrophosphatase MutT (NUDIX family)